MAAGDVWVEVPVASRTMREAPPRNEKAEIFGVAITRWRARGTEAHVTAAKGCKTSIMAGTLRAKG